MVSSYQTVIFRVLIRLDEELEVAVMSLHNHKCTKRTSKKQIHALPTLIEIPFADTYCVYKLVAGAVLVIT